MFSEAHDCLGKALKIRQHERGVYDFSYAVTLENIASVYVKQDKYTKAEENFEKVLEIKQKVRGKNLDYA